MEPEQLLNASDRPRTILWTPKDTHLVMERSSPQLVGVGSWPRSPGYTTALAFSQSCWHETVEDDSSYTWATGVDLEASVDATTCSSRRDVLPRIQDSSLKTGRLRENNRARPRRAFYCTFPLCDYTAPFPRQYELDRHVKTCHHVAPDGGPLTLFECAHPSCHAQQRTWARLDKLREHIRKSHPDVKDINAFIQRYSLAPRRFVQIADESRSTVEPPSATTPLPAPDVQLGTRPVFSETTCQSSQEDAKLTPQVEAVPSILPGPLIETDDEEAAVNHRSIIINPLPLSTRRHAVLNTIAEAASVLDHSPASRSLNAAESPGLDNHNLQPTTAPIDLFGLHPRRAVSAEALYRPSSTKRLVAVPLAPEDGVPRPSSSTSDILATGTSNAARRCHSATSCAYLQCAGGHYTQAGNGDSSSRSAAKSFKSASSRYGTGQGSLSNRTDSATNNSDGTTSPDLAAGARKRPRTTSGLAIYPCVFCKFRPTDPDDHSECQKKHRYVSGLGRHHNCERHDHFVYCTICLQEFNTKEEKAGHTCDYKCVTEGCPSYNTHPGTICQHTNSDGSQYSGNSQRHKWLELYRMGCRRRGLPDDFVPDLRVISFDESQLSPPSLGSGTPGSSHVRSLTISTPMDASFSAAPSNAEFTSEQPDEAFTHNASSSAGPQDMLPANLGGRLQALQNFARLLSQQIRHPQAARLEVLRSMHGSVMRTVLSAHTRQARDSTHWRINFLEDWIRLTWSEIDKPTQDCLERLSYYHQMLLSPSVDSMTNASVPMPTPATHHSDISTSQATNATDNNLGYDGRNHSASNASFPGTMVVAQDVLASPFNDVPAAAGDDHVQPSSSEQNWASWNRAQSAEQPTANIESFHYNPIRPDSGTAQRGSYGLSQVHMGLQGVPQSPASLAAQKLPQGPWSTPVHNPSITPNPFQTPLSAATISPRDLHLQPMIPTTPFYNMSPPAPTFAPTPQSIARTELGFRTDQPLNFGQGPTAPQQAGPIYFPHTYHDSNAAPRGGEQQNAKQSQHAAFREHDSTYGTAEDWEWQA